MKKTILFVLISLSGILTAQFKITYGGYDTPKEYFNNHYTKHYEAGLLISGTVGYTMNYFIERPALSALTGLGAGITAGICKEAIWDKQMGLGHCNNMSAISTIMGSAVSAVANAIIFHLQHRKNHYAKWLFNEEIKDIMK